MIVLDVKFLRRVCIWWIRVVNECCIYSCKTYQQRGKNAFAFLIKNCTSSGGSLVMCDVGWTSRISFAQILTRTTPPRPHAFTLHSLGRTDGLSSWLQQRHQTLDLILLYTRISLDMHASTRTRSGMRNWRNPLLSLRVCPRRRAFVITFGAASENSSSLILTISITIDSYTTLLCALVSQRGCFRHPIAARGQIHAWSDSSLP